MIDRRSIIAGFAALAALGRAATVRANENDPWHEVRPLLMPLLDLKSSCKPLGAPAAALSVTAITIIAPHRIHMAADNVFWHVPARRTDFAGLAWMDRLNAAVARANGRIPKVRGLLRPATLPDGASMTSIVGPGIASGMAAHFVFPVFTDSPGSPFRVFQA
jgi:hypothetical protein